MAKPIESARIAWRRDLNDTLAIFRFELENGVPDYLPGQFITLGLPDPENPAKIPWRAYSIASPPSRKEYLELYIRRPMSPQPGKFTSLLWDLPVGSTVQHRGITGPFTIEPSNPDASPDLRTLLCVGGGTGVAPFVAYAFELAKNDVPRQMVLVHGASYVHELGYADLLEELQASTRAAGPDEFRLTYLPTISRGTDPQNAAWTGQVGRADQVLIPPSEGVRSRLEELLGDEIVPERYFCHACGYEGTVKAAQTVLEPRGFVSRRNRRPDGSFDYKVESYG